ncbi:MAG: flagellar basal-body rod protein FlgF [Nitrospirota bacterium]|nr:flagellar basal-body rod protein FlgF [Nitrospirota bacterium]
MNSIYPVLSGALAQEKRLELITNNLANVSTSGFKKDIAVFEGLTPLSRDAAGTNVQFQARLLGSDSTFGLLKTVETDFSAGAIQITDEPLDLAIQGEGFFAVQSPEGVRYTRNGHFTLDSGRQLVTTSGYPVLGSGGPISFPPGIVTIDSSGNISVRGSEAGATIIAVDILPVYTVSNPNNLKKVGGSLFKVVNGTAVPSIEGQIQQGALEGSNVNPVEEMVAMISVMRHYEAAQKAIQTADDIAGKAANEIGRMA